MGGDLSFYGMLAAGALGVFALVIIIGMVMRFVKAPRGSRMRHAFGPLMGAGEQYQELHTGQKGLHDSVIESIQEQETKGSKRETGAGSASGADDAGEGDAGRGDTGEGATRDDTGEGDTSDPSAR